MPGHPIDDDEYPPGHLAEMFTESPELLAKLKDAPMVVAFCMETRDVEALWGRKEYALAGGPAELPGDCGRIDAGISKRNDATFPPGAWVVGYSCNTDDLIVLVAAIQRLKGRVQFATQYEGREAERN